MYSKGVMMCLIYPVKYGINNTEIHNYNTLLLSLVTIEHNYTVHSMDIHLYKCSKCTFISILSV